MPKTSTDCVFLEEALIQAKIRRGFCAPNPAVGAVIVKDQNIIARGYHHEPGCAHAEIDALKKVKQSLDGATLYVTLEPCCHYGKTPPCTDAIIAAGIKHVIYAYQDPNPKVAGQGHAKLVAAGISCKQRSLPAIDVFYESYHYWQRTQLPFVTVKLAITLDGKIAGANSQPLVITGATVNALTHQYRKHTDAILTTINTILQDNPQLNARTQKGVFPKTLYILDRNLKLPLSSKIFTTAQSITIFHSGENNTQDLEAAGVTCIIATELADILKIIGCQGVHDLWVEAGGKCFSAFIQQKLFQRALLYVAPKTCIEGIPAFTQDFEFHAATWQQIGADLVATIPGFDYDPL